MLQYSTFSDGSEGRNNKEYNNKELQYSTFSDGSEGYRSHNNNTFLVTVQHIFGW